MLRMLEMFGVVAQRTDSSLESSSHTYLYHRIKKSLKELKQVDGDSSLVRRAIDDAHYYFDTLQGTKREYRKDSFPIRSEVLRERLTSLDQLIVKIKASRNAGDDKILIEAYNAIKPTIEFGWINASNLIDTLTSTIDKAKSGELKVEAPQEYLCPISEEIMKDPVMGNDGITYERAKIEEWIERNGGFGKAMSPMRNPDPGSRDYEKQLKEATLVSLTPNISLKNAIAKFASLAKSVQNELGVAREEENHGSSFGVTTTSSPSCRN